MLEEMCINIPKGVNLTPNPRVNPGPPFIKPPFKGGGGGGGANEGPKKKASAPKAPSLVG